MSNLLFTGHDWTHEILMNTWEVIERIAKEKYGLDFYEPQFELVTANQMLHYSSLGGLPFLYNHWSFGKQFLKAKEAFEAGNRGLAYEMIINTNPAICYIMETNDMRLQTLVMAHAAVGHSSFFKTSGIFKQWTKPDTILDYVRFAIEYIHKCETQFGEDEVEAILDAAHALQNIGLDKYPRTRHRKSQAARDAETLRLQSLLAETDELWASIPQKKKKAPEHKDDFAWSFPEENVLYFIEKNSPSLEPWQKEIVRIVRTIHQYFYPQYLTKIMNEGWASFWHYTLSQDLYEGGYIDEGTYIELLRNHTQVAHQYEPYRAPGRPILTPNLNPYALGFKIFRKLRQACEDPTEQDFKELPAIAGTPWLETFKSIVENYTDASFLGNFLTTDVMHDLGLLTAVRDREKEDPNYITLTVETTEDNRHLREARNILHRHTSIEAHFPSISVIGCDMKSDRTLHLKHKPFEGQMLDDDNYTPMMKYLRELWGPYPITMETIDKAGTAMKRARKW